ncbi:MAG: galactonate dehydratase [Chloroflexi bacterium]|nr:galactonate dehydratase [Chloroflexota bacterium]
MKITDVKLIEANVWRWVRISTDEGLSGIGEMHGGSGGSGTPYTVAAAVQYMAEYLIGKDPLHIEKHWQHMFRRQLFRGGADPMAAIGAIDCALWDIKGKEAGKPVYALLGGPTRERIRLYVHLTGDSPEALADDARRRIAEGYTAVRFYPLGQFNHGEFESASYTAIARIAEDRVRAVREAVGSDIDMMIDVVNRLTPPEALLVARACEPYNLYFFEDPIEPDNMEALAEFSRRAPMPVAAGERLQTIYQFSDLLSRNAAAFIRPDISLAGGITGIRKIAALAEANYVGVIPHNPMAAIATASCAHLDAALSNVPIQEYPGDEWEGPKLDLVPEPLEFDNGYLILRDTPGLGVELNDEAVKHYPPVSFDRAPVMNRDGSLRDY